MIKKISNSRLLSAVFIASFGFIFGANIWAYMALKNVGGPIILHFNSISGITQIGSVYNLLFIGITAGVAVLINFFLALELEQRDWFLGKIVAAATFVIAVLIFIAFAAIISVN